MDLKNLKISQFSWKSCDEGLKKLHWERLGKKPCCDGHFRRLKCCAQSKPRLKTHWRHLPYCIFFSRSSSLVSFWPVLNDALKKNSWIWRFSSLRHWDVQGFFLTSLHEQSWEFFFQALIIDFSKKLENFKIFRGVSNLSSVYCSMSQIHCWIDQILPTTRTKEWRQVVKKGAEYGAISDAIYENTIPCTHNLGHSIIAQGKHQILHG
jgi:hypothetical protein